MPYNLENPFGFPYENSVLSVYSWGKLGKMIFKFSTWAWSALSQLIAHDSQNRRLSGVYSRHEIQSNKWLRVSVRVRKWSLRPTILVVWQKYKNQNLHLPSKVFYGFLCCFCSKIKVSKFGRGTQAPGCIWMTEVSLCLPLSPPTITTMKHADDRTTFRD